MVSRVCFDGRSVGDEYSGGGLSRGGPVSDQRAHSGGGGGLRRHGGAPSGSACLPQGAGSLSCAWRKSNLGQVSNYKFSAHVQNLCGCKPDPVRPERTLSPELVEGSKGKSKGERCYVHKFQT